MKTAHTRYRQVNESEEALEYPVDEAIADAARWIEGVTMYRGMRGWQAACAVLSREVQKLREENCRLMVICLNKLACEFEAVRDKQSADSEADSQ